MIELCADIGYKSENHIGEELCGDHVEIVSAGEDENVVVLADGMGSGVRACILSTLTAKIISTMLAKGLGLEESVSTIVRTLPQTTDHGAAYSTFSVLHLKGNRTAELIRFDAPPVIMLRNGERHTYDTRETVIEGKKILRSEVALQENDLFALMSDGCPYAGKGGVYNFQWDENEIASYLATMSAAQYSARALSSMLVDECCRLYENKPEDDVTACVVRIRKRVPVHLIYGPPEKKEDGERMMRLFFSKAGSHIIAGGTTASIAAKWLNKPLKPAPDYLKQTDLPPISVLDGADLVTEGTLTIGRVITYAEDYLGKNTLYETWSYGQDGASRMSRMLFEEATDICFYVGRAVNPAHEDMSARIGFSHKMQQVETLSQALRQMGKQVKVSYF